MSIAREFRNSTKYKTQRTKEEKILACQRACLNTCSLFTCRLSSRTMNLQKIFMTLKELLVSCRPIIVGILNVTKDSFSDGGEYFSTRKAVERAEEMMRDGAHIIDVGGESTAPGSEEVPLEEEWKRLKDILHEFKEREIPFSVDTWKSGIAERAAPFNPLYINDVTGLRGDAEMARFLSASHLGVCIMYSKDKTARTTIKNDEGKGGVVQKISSYFEERLMYAKENGIEKEKIILDPGMGAFLSSDPEASFEVIRRLGEFQRFGCPILVGTSRKSFLREVSHQTNPKKRLIASVVTSLVAIQNGASLIRVHDVLETAEGMRAYHKCIL